MHLSDYQKQLDSYYRSQGASGFWIEKYKPYHSLYRDRLVKRNAAIAAALPDQLGRVLDLGCGRGDIMAAFAGRASAVVGTDLSEVMVQATRQNLRTYPNVSALCCPAESLPFADSTFDAVVLADVVEHLVDVPIALRECNRILRPGGRVVITTPNARMEHFWQRVDGGLAAPLRIVAAVAKRGRSPKPAVYEHFFAVRKLAQIAHESALKIEQHRLIEFYPGSEGGGTFGRVLRLIAREKHSRRFLVEPVFRAVFKSVESLRVFNNRQLLVLRKLGVPQDERVSEP